MENKNEKKPLFSENEDSKNNEDLKKPVDEFESSPEVVEDLHVERIRIAEITGPLIIFYGPREIGKTVTLLRLFMHISDEYQVIPNRDFRGDRQYQIAIDAFEKIKNDGYVAPEATGNINFLLLDICENSGSSFCQILEAPAEHFFDTDNPKKSYHDYMNRILASNYQKIFVFFFEIGMFDRNENHQKSYVNKIVELIRKQVNSRKDRILILCNKADLQPYIKDGRPIKKEFVKNFYNKDFFKPLKSMLDRGGYKFKYEHFIPFSAGTFNEDDQGQKTFARSKDHYPDKLWTAITTFIVGKTPFSFFNRFRRR